MFLALVAVLPIWSSSSYYTARLDDAKAVYLTEGEFGAKGDGKADDSEALQKAIDAVNDRTIQGILFVPEGRYRLSKTVYIWPGIRLIGYGARRPVLVLGENTPGFQQAPRYMMFFAGNRPGHIAGSGFKMREPTAEQQVDEEKWLSGDRARDEPRDANPGTFYSAISNIDFEIKDGNPGAAAVRAHYAQHCFLAHMDFQIGSGLAGIRDGGNLAEDVHFHGGRYGIWTRKPSPGWQFTLIDATFEGQREAAIREHEAGLTLIRPQFKNVPGAISIDSGYSDELYMKDGRLENVSGPAFVISNEKSPRTEISIEDTVCDRVPVFAMFRESKKTINGVGAVYRVRELRHGLQPPAMEVNTGFEAAAIGKMPEQAGAEIPVPPAAETWVNIRSLGAKGDGVADDTDVFKKAIAEQRAIYVPCGAYRVTDTIRLRADTVLIGLHPSATRMLLADGTPGYQGVGEAKPLLEAPQGGRNIVMGIGLDTNGINPRAVAAKWMANENSLMNDVRFLGGHGTTTLEGMRLNPYNSSHSADPDPRRKWDSQYPSLWITNGGGGTFMDIWTPSTFAQAGLLISGTTTRGRVYELSSEHHVRNEIEIRNAGNWELDALQTEEERGESGFALPLDIENSHDITIANMHMYRVVSSFQPSAYGVKATNAHNVRFLNLHCDTDAKASFGTPVFDATEQVAIRQREFQASTLPAGPPEQAQTKVEKVADGFFNISGGVIDEKGRLYFVDAHRQQILRYEPEWKRVNLVRDSPLEPVNLAMDQAGHLMVISYEGNGTVYTFDPERADGEIQLLKPRATEEREASTVFLPVNLWKNEHDFEAEVTAKKPWQFLSPDGSTYIRAGQDFVDGELYYGAKVEDVIRAFGLAPTKAGERFYVCDESEEKTYSGVVNADGSLRDLKLFANVGGESVTTDASGSVYIAAGEIYVYSPAGTPIRTIAVPERPVQLLFGGRDRRTLLIEARTALYSVHIGTGHE